jgi:hypothetical protein
MDISFKLSLFCENLATMAVFPKSKAFYPSLRLAGVVNTKTLKPF